MFGPDAGSGPGAGDAMPPCCGVLVMSTGKLAGGLPGSGSSGEDGEGETVVAPRGTTDAMIGLK